MVSLLPTDGRRVFTGWPWVSLSGKKLPCCATTTPQQVCALLAAPSLLTAVTCWGCRLCAHLFPGQVSTCLLHPRAMNMPGVSLAGSTCFVCTSTLQCGFVVECRYNQSSRCHVALRQLLTTLRILRGEDICVFSPQR